jgi:hypothetical protein
MSPALLVPSIADRFADELYRICLFGPCSIFSWNLPSIWAYRLIFGADIEKKSWFYLEECVSTLSILLTIPKIASNFFTRNLHVLLKGLEGGCARLSKDPYGFQFESYLVSSYFALLGTMRKASDKYDSHFRTFCVIMLTYEGWKSQI